MTQTPFKAYNAVEKFEPVKNAGEGLIDSAKENQDKFLQSIVKRNAALFKYELDEATRKDQRWNKLAQLSTTAASIAKPMLEAQTNEKYMEGAEAWYNVSAKNQDILQAEFDAEEQIEIDEDKIHGSIVEKSYKNNEIDIFLKHELSNLTRRQQVGFLRAMYQDRAEQYPMFLQQNSTVPVQIRLEDGTFTQRTLEGAENPNEYRQIEQRLYRAYIRPFATHEQAGVNKYLYEKMRDHNKNHYEQWYQKRTKVLESEAEEKDVNEVLNSEKIGEALVNYYNKFQPRHGGPSQTRDFINGKIIEEIKAGNFEIDDLIKLGDTPVTPRDGSAIKKPFKDVFKKDYEKLEDEVISAIEANKNKLDVEDAIDLDKYIKAEDEFVDRAREEGKPVSAAAVDEMQRTLRNLHPKGEESEKLKQIKKDLTIDATTLRKERDKVLELASQGKLTTQKLREFSYQIYTDGKLIQIAQEQDKLYANTHYKEHKATIKAAVEKYQRNINPDGIDESAILLTAKLQQDYVRYLKEFENPQQALQLVLSEFETDWAPNRDVTTGRYDLKKLGVDLDRYKKIDVTKIEKLQHSNLHQKGTIFTQAQLEKLGSDPNEWTDVPIEAKIVGRIFGFTPIQVVNFQREAYGLEPLSGTTKALEAVEASIQPDVQKLICRYNTHDRSSRCWGTTGKDNTEIVPEEKKEEIDEISQANNIPFAKAAAFSDVTQTNPLVIDYSDIPDQYMTQFWSSVYKYSGGKDKEALTNLIRPTLANSYGD